MSICDGAAAQVAQMLYRVPSTMFDTTMLYVPGGRPMSWIPVPDGVVMMSEDPKSGPFTQSDRMAKVALAHVLAGAM